MAKEQSETSETEQDSRDVAIFLDLETRDGRRAVEVRAVQPLAQGFFASPRSTLYSCAYSTQAERILALQRARLFCDLRGRRVVHFGCAVDRRAAWQ
ncbi:MAG TPA: hypothetical protein VFF73_36390 [Planctomycetota bacterium]|nr:hypothetical protein [Planctomycetota bacterium]